MLRLAASGFGALPRRAGGGGGNRRGRGLVAGGPGEAHGPSQGLHARGASARIPGEFSPALWRKLAK